MELTPKIAQMDISEDSGCVTASSMETTSSLYESTPSITYQSTTHVISRKRKLPYTSHPAKRKSPQYSTIDTPKASPWFASSKDFLSSTLNESKDVNNFITDNVTPNFYIERKEFTTSSGESCSGYHEQAVPSTPPRTSESKLTEHLNLSHSKSNSYQKLGSPERNEILYPNLKFLGSPYKPRTPQKFAESLKRYTPAKKRLFGVTKREKLDPITFFMNDNKRFEEIVSKLFSHLEDQDLYTAHNVSKKWRNAIFSCKHASKRLSNFMKYCSINKENITSRKPMSCTSSPCSPRKSSPPSPRSKKFYKFIELGRCLREGQSLQKCPKCESPSIVEQNISQCQQDTCGYIYCIFCNSFSTRGPENFIDQCQTSKLVIEKPEKTKLEALLSDSPMKDVSDGDVPSFLRRDSSFNSSLHNSSEYITDLELTSAKILNSSLKEKSNILQDSNRGMVRTRKSLTRRSSLVSVVPIKSLKDEIIEPSSPPKIRNVSIGSKASKKNLKRLFSS